MKSNAYNFSNDLARIGSALSRAMIGNASDDAAIALAQYRNAQTEGQNQENTFRKGQFDAIDTASAPTGMLSQSMLNSQGVGLDENNNFVKLQPPGARPQTIPAYANQNTMTQADMLSQAGAMARAIFGDGKYSPNQLTEALGDLSANRDSNMARSMILDPETAEDALRRAAIVLNQDQFVKMDNNAADNIASGERNAADNIAAGERNAADNIASGERNAADNIASGERNAADNIASGERNNATIAATMLRNVADNIAAGERNAADNIASGERNAADNIASGERNAADNIASGERNAADNIAAGERNTADNIASGERNAADNIASGERNAADNIAAGERNDADNTAAANKPGADTRKRPSVKDSNTNWTAVTDTVAGYDNLPPAVKGKLRVKLLKAVDQGMTNNPKASYDAVYAQAVIAPLLSGMTDITPSGLGNDFVFPSFIYQQLIGRESSFIKEAAKELGYSDKQAQQVADQVLAP